MKRCEDAHERRDVGDEQERDLKKDDRKKTKKQEKQQDKARQDKKPERTTPTQYDGRLERERQIIPPE